MARILAWTSPARGHLYPLMAVLLELRRRGHDLTLFTLADEAERVGALGIDARRLPADVERIPLLDWRARTTPGALTATVRAFGRRAPFDAAAMSRAIDDVRPDALLVDINAWGAMAAAERWGSRWGVFCPYPLVLSSPDVPPFGPGLPPARGPAGRIRDRVLRPLLTGGMERAMRPPLNAVRSSLGLGPLATVDDVVRRPPLVLSMTARPLEYPRGDWPSSVVMVGPCAWDPPQPVPAWVDGLSRPVALVTTSSEFQDDGRLAASALEGLADLPVEIVVTVPAADRARLPAPPANARVETFVPHGPLLQRACVAVTHGGMGATQKALAHGVPVVAVPFGRDQHEVARRVEVAGAGVRLPRRRLRPDTLRRAVTRAMTMADGASRVASGFAAAGGPAAAADAVEARLLDGAASVGV